MFFVRKSDSVLAVFLPYRSQAPVLLSFGYRQVERFGHMLRPVAQRLEASIVLAPLVRHSGHRGEEFCLLMQSRLLVVSSVERIKFGEELLRVRWLSRF